MTRVLVRRDFSWGRMTGPARGRRRLAVVLGLLAVLLAAAGSAAVPAAAGITDSVTATIGVGTGPLFLQSPVSPRGRRAAVTW